jgi:hypothetical protein
MSVAWLLLYGESKGRRVEITFTGWQLGVLDLTKVK